MQVVSRLEDEVEVSPAATYPEALTAIASNPTFDLILVEWNLLPMTEGSSVADVVSRAGNTPVVIVSEVDSRDVVAQATAAGAAGFLSKSSPISSMQDALRIVLGGGAFFPVDGQRTVGPAEATAPQHNADALSDADRARINLLTNRQRDVLALVGEGRSNKDIAEVLGISEGTVKVHVGAILKALGTANRTQAALIAIDVGIASLPHDTHRARRA
jgi:DNA-binding NarL/FixJ family response regulator